MAVKGRPLSIRDERDWGKKAQKYAMYKRALAQDAVDERFQKMYDDALAEHNARADDLVSQQRAAGVDRQKQREIQAMIDQENKSWGHQMDGILSAHSRARAETNDLSQYNGTTEEIEAYARQIADQEAQKSQAPGESVKDKMGGYFEKRFGGNEKSGGKEETIQVPGMWTPNPNDPFGNKNFLTGHDDTNSINLGTFGRIGMTDEQKEQVAKDKQNKEDEKAKQAQENSGGGAFDSSQLQHNVDEEGNATFTKKNDNPDLTYHPALDAAKAVRPDDNESSRNPDMFGLGLYLARRFNRDDKDPMNRSGHLRRQAEMHDIEAGDHQRAMQASNQIANRDYRSEAEKNAASQAAAENAQKVHNLGNAGAGAAALERDVKAADYNTMMQRSDEQRKQGVENMEKMHDMRQVAEQERSGADVYDYTARDMSDYNAQSDWLSMSPFGNGGRKKPADTKTKPDNNQPEVRQTDYPPETEEGESRYINNVSHQDLLNACMSKWYGEVKAAHPNVPAYNDLRGKDWKEISRTPGHTIAGNKELDTQEYYDAVEELAQKLWSGEPVTVDGQTYGGNGKSGAEAVYDLYVGRGGDKGDIERINNPEKWKRQNTGELNVKQE